MTIVSGRQAVTVRQGMAGRTSAIWAVLHSVHLVLDGHVLRIVASRVLPSTGRSWPCAAPGPPGRRGWTPVAQTVEAHRKVHRDRHVFIDGGRYQVGTCPPGPLSPCG
jgi:hypothetical protein